MSNERIERRAGHELELLRSELDTLYQVSKVLSRSLNLKETLDGVLHALHEGVALERGMVSLIDAASGELQVSLVYGVSDAVTEEVSYLPGEGVVGTILKTGSSIVVESIMDEPRFLSRMGIYNPQGAFVGVPIRVGQKVIGVLAAQPAASITKQLGEYQHFLEMVGNLIGQSVRLSQEVAQEKKEICRGTRCTAPHCARAIRLRQHHRPHPVYAPHLRTGAAGGEVEHHRADTRRNRHREGIDRQRHPLQLAARAGQLRQAQLCGIARDVARVGIVRP